MLKYLHDNGRNSNRSICTYVIMGKQKRPQSSTNLQSTRGMSYQEDYLLLWHVLKVKKITSLK